MSRWEPDAPARLERAALELFVEQGYAATTVPQITARAGLTTRTFFRHFADKREVLFRRERDFPVIVATVLSDAPAALSPMDLAMHGFEVVATDRFDSWRTELGVRRAIIQSDERLRERELLKSSVLSDVIERALVDHGVDASTAALVAASCVMIFDTALGEWLDGEEDRRLVDVLRATRARLRSVLV